MVDNFLGQLRLLSALYDRGLRSVRDSVQAMEEQLCAFDNAFRLERGREWCAEDAEVLAKEKAKEKAAAKVAKQEKAVANGAAAEIIGYSSTQKMIRYCMPGTM